jgi:hypothetical protein
MLKVIIQHYSGVEIMKNDGFKESHKFRNLLDLWEANCEIEGEIEKINGLFDKHGMIIFFKKDDDLYGAPESSRLVFAKLRSKDADNPISIGLQDQIRVPAINLIKAMFGDEPENSQVALTADDLENMEVCDRDEIINALMARKK